MAKNKKQYVNPAEGLFNSISQNTKNNKKKEINIQEVQEEQEVQEVQEVQEENKRKSIIKQETKERVEFGKTQGRKGKKSPRINMAFSPENYDFIIEKSFDERMNYTQFVNYIIDKERKKY